MLSVDMNSYVIMTIATMMLVAAIGIAMTTTTTAFAQGDPRNGWGQAAKDTIAAFSGREFGQHTSNPDPTNDDPHDTPRLGVGNLADLLTQQKNPDLLGQAVSGTLS
jgi:hypothetical protein